MNKEGLRWLKQTFPKQMLVQGIFLLNFSMGYLQSQSDFMSVFGAVRRTRNENEAKNGCRLYQEDESCFQNKLSGHFQSEIYQIC